MPAAWPIRFHRPGQTGGTRALMRLETAGKLERAARRDRSEKALPVKTSSRCPPAIRSPAERLRWRIHRPGEASRHVTSEAGAWDQADAPAPSRRAHKPPSHQPRIGGAATTGFGPSEICAFARYPSWKEMWDALDVVLRREGRSAERAGHHRIGRPWGIVQR